MTQVATVERIVDETHAEISVPRKSACGHDCEDCAGCGVMGYAVHATAENTAKARPGDKVIVESSTKKVMGIVVLVYVLPFVCFFLGYAAGMGLLHFGDGMSGLVGAICFLLGLIPALLYNRHVKKNGSLQYEIIRLFQSGD